MTCIECQNVVSSLVDGELDTAELEAVEAHLTHCAECGRRRAALVDLRRRLRAELPRHVAPDLLIARVRAAAGSAQSEARVESVRRAGLRPWPVAVAVIAAVVIAAVSSGLTTLVIRSRGGAKTDVAAQVLESHIRSLMPGHLTDIASTDQHNVKPWFNGRVDLSPPVPRLDSAGFVLVGGRLDYIDGHVAAAVVYARRQHLINVLSWPEQGSPDQGPVESVRNGYRLISTRRAGIERWVVSDLNEAELQEFVRRYDEQ